MYTSELIFRFATVSQLVLIAIILVKHHRDKASGVLGAALALGIASDLMLPLVGEWDHGHAIRSVVRLELSVYTQSMPGQHLNALRKIA